MVATGVWEELLDRRFELELALGDVQRGDGTPGDDIARQLAWLREHVERLVEVDLSRTTSPPTQHPPSPSS